MSYNAPQYNRGHGHYSPPPEPPKRRRRWISGRNVLMVLGAVFILSVFVSMANPGQEPGVSSLPEPAQAAGPDSPGFGERVVTLQVEGEGSATVSYMKAGGQEQQEVSLPWSGDVTADFVTSLTAQKQGGGSSPITCKIVEDGEVIAESTSSGQYAVVSCSD